MSARVITAVSWLGSCFGGHIVAVVGHAFAGRSTCIAAILVDFNQAENDEQRIECEFRNRTIESLSYWKIKPLERRRPQCVKLNDSSRLITGTD